MCVRATSALLVKIVSLGYECTRHSINKLFVLQLLKQQNGQSWTFFFCSFLYPPFLTPWILKLKSSDFRQLQNWCCCFLNFMLNLRFMFRNIRSSKWYVFYGQITEHRVYCLWVAQSKRINSKMRINFYFHEMFCVCKRDLSYSLTWLNLTA